MNSYYQDTWDVWGRCFVELGCGQTNTSPAELEALKDFYTSTGGPSWRFQYNWNEGDPCQNNWFGVQCNYAGQVITLHFFENGLNGVLPLSM